MFYFPLTKSSIGSYVWLFSQDFPQTD